MEGGIDIVDRCLGPCTRGTWVSCWAPQDEGELSERVKGLKHRDFRDLVPPSMEEVQEVYRVYVRDGHWTVGLLEMWAPKAKHVKHPQCIFRAGRASGCCRGCGGVHGWERPGTNVCGRDGGRCVGPGPPTAALWAESTSCRSMTSAITGTAPTFGLCAACLAQWHACYRAVSGRS